MPHPSVQDPSPSALCCSPLASAPLSEDEAADVAKVLKAVADPTRMRLLS